MPFLINCFFFSMINKECGFDARQAMLRFMDKAFGGKSKKKKLKYGKSKIL